MGVGRDVGRAAVLLPTDNISALIRVCSFYLNSSLAQ
jgi:hypothetical protein